MKDTRFNYSKLLGRIKEMGLTQGDLAKLIGRTPVFISKHFSGGLGFKSVDIFAMCSVLSIDDSDIHVYFFSVSI